MEKGEEEEEEDVEERKRGGGGGKRSRSWFTGSEVVSRNFVTKTQIAAKDEKGERKE